MLIYRHSWSLVGLKCKSITLPMKLVDVPCCGERNFICVGSVRSPNFEFNFQELVCISCGIDFFIDINTDPCEIYSVNEMPESNWGYDDVFDIQSFKL